MTMILTNLRTLYSANASSLVMSSINNSDDARDDPQEPHGYFDEEGLDYQIQDALENDDYEEDAIQGFVEDNAYHATIQNDQGAEEEEAEQEPATLQNDVIASHDYILHFRDDAEENHLTHDINANTLSQQNVTSKEFRACIIPLRVLSIPPLHCRRSSLSPGNAFPT